MEKYTEHDEKLVIEFVECFADEDKGDTMALFFGWLDEGWDEPLPDLEPDRTRIAAERYLAMIQKLDFMGEAAGLLPSATINEMKRKEGLPVRTW